MHANRLALASLVVSAAILAGGGCATSNSKFTFSDRASRLMFDTREIPEAQLALIQDALLKGDRFVLVERTDSKSDQEGLDKLAEGDKKARWALWGTKYEIGGVVTARAQCRTQERFLGGKKTYCHQYLAIMHPQTGKIISSAEGENSIAVDAGHAPDWDDVSNKLVEKFDQVKPTIVFGADKPIRAVASEPAASPSVWNSAPAPASAPAAAPAAAAAAPVPASAQPATAPAASSPPASTVPASSAPTAAPHAKPLEVEPMTHE